MPEHTNEADSRSSTTDPPRWPRWLSPALAALYLSTPVGTLKKWRSCRRGPRYAAPTRGCVRYDVRELDAWLEGATRETDPLTGGAK